jgi:hypothetical protein
MDYKLRILGHRSDWKSAAARSWLWKACLTYWWEQETLQLKERVVRKSESGRARFGTRGSFPITRSLRPLRLLMDSMTT